MKNRIKLVYSLLLSVVLTGCASTLKPQDLKEVETVGVVNEFPEYPNFVTTGTTIFNNDYDAVKDSSFSDLLVKTVKDYVEAKGMAVKLISESEIGDVDMAIKLVPRDIYGVSNTFGYGVHQQSIFGKRMGAITYVSLNVVPYIDGDSKCSTCYLKGVKVLDIEELPAQFSLLSQDEQAHVKDSLDNNIQETLTKILIDSGI
ncbi:hypothetical protein [Vibrio alginolyticus]|uniref:hypothetical protein n=1 Tax=Vibrio alginolyticus TaxID=663 RepID=UPI001BD3EA20|nr:hypothetical protein [Vibrio alginolyticus]MBT0082624.1 hypothetical protein [Vibrio alginolyticus]MBT0105870.1 hypothetical protein [Vibrio alginolyticus]